MAIYTQPGEESLRMTDSLLGDLHIPMNIITDAITHTADDDFNANQIEAYIRNAIALRGSANAEAEVVPSAEEISLENAESDRSLELAIGDETYRVNTAQFETLSELAIWMSETLNQAKERTITDHVAKLESDLRKAGSLPDNMTLKIKI